MASLFERSFAKVLGGAALAACAGFASIPGAQAAPPLVPPQPYVPTANGAKLTLEQAGILKPGGREWAVALGKAFFWDIRTGGSGVACATCHFNAGADSRTVNQLSPGFLSRPTEDLRFGGVASFEGEPLYSMQVGRTWSGGVVDSTYELKPEDFPFHALSDRRNRNSAVLFTTNDVGSSNGFFDAVFGRIAGSSGVEQCGESLADVFHAGGFAARQVAPRNTPTTINAIFNFRSLWDGRGNNMFNGVGVFGPRDIAGDPNKRLVILEGGAPVLGHLDIRNASLASQALGAPLSGREMSCEGRTFADIGRKLLSATARPLETQRVHPNDSVLGPLADASGRGLDRRHSYAALIKRAFNEKYWAAQGRFRIVDGQLQVSRGGGVAGYTQMEMNFSMFWGIAIMLYEATLVSDQSPFDTWFAMCDPVVTNPDGSLSTKVPIDNPIVTCRKPIPSGATPATLVPGFGEAEVLGFGLFNNGGMSPRQPGSPACARCHTVTNRLFSAAQFRDGDTFVPVERTRVENRGPGTAAQLEGAVRDRGFFNTGSRPTSFDIGNGGRDPYGNPLSLARLFLDEQAGNAVVEPTGIGDRCGQPGLIELGAPLFATCSGALDAEREMVDGSFKTPSIRNIALTPPYYHGGSYSDLRSVVEFYARGGNQRDKSLAAAGATGDTSGTGPLGKGTIPVAGPHFGTNVDFFMRDIKSTDEQIDAMVAFMKSVTDRRVQCDAAPFDHPELPVPLEVSPVDANRDGRADDVMAVIPAVGAGGYQADGRGNLCLPNAGDLFHPDLRNRLVRNPS